MAPEHKCCNKQTVKMGAWSAEEDETLYMYITNHDQIKWSSIPELTGLKRCGKSCRLRWINYLKPDIKRGNFTTEEVNLIFSLQKSIGNKWSQIAMHLPGRTDNEIKNFWNSKQKNKKVLGSNIQTHESSSTSETNHHISVLESSDHHYYPGTHTANFQPNYGPNMHSSVDYSLNEEPSMNQLYTIPSEHACPYCYNNHHQALTHPVFNPNFQLASNADSIVKHGWMNSSASYPMFSTSSIHSSIWMTPTSYAQNFPTECQVNANLITWLDDDQPYSSQPSEIVDINEFFNFNLYEEDSMKAEASQINNSHVI